MQTPPRKIALIIAYFGTMPNYLNLFLKGMVYNPDIDFLFFTDWDYTALERPDNFKARNFTLDEFNSLASSKLGLKINIQNGYKLCDLKPAWPLIFEDYIHEYDYVGWCDIDLILGNVSAFLPAKDFDFFTVTTTYASGAFSLIKNSEKMRNRFKMAKGWDYIFTDKRHFAFDEWIRQTEDLPQGGVQSFSDVVIKNNDIITVADKYIGYESRPELLEYRNGHVYVENNEYIFFHLVASKQFVAFVVPNWQKYPDIFYVNRYGFYADRKKPLKLTNLLLSLHSLSQMHKTANKKIQTATKLLKSLQIKKLWHIFISQF